MKSNLLLNLITKAVLAAVIFYLVSANCYAQWSSNAYTNNEVCTYEGSQGNSVIAPDGNGGAIIAWSDERTGFPNDDIYAQRFDSNGIVQWAINGIPICTAASLQAQVVIVSDGAGGAIIAWADLRNLTELNPSNIDIYAQRVNANGEIQWAAEGVCISDAPGKQDYPKIVTDGNGGAIITWSDQRIENPINNDIYAQCINANGTLKGPEVAVCSNIGGQVQPNIISDNNGGAIIAWSDSRNITNSGDILTDTSATDIYAQRIGTNGLAQWTTDGVAICLARRFQGNPALTADGSGGAIITWIDDRDANNTYPSNGDIYAQRINASGTLQWTSLGIAVCTDFNNQVFQQITTDGSGGAFISWVSWAGYGPAATSKISVQHINGSGTTHWMNNGIPVGPGDNENPMIVYDNSGGLFLVFEAKIFSGHDIYAQHIGADGLEIWRPFGGVLVSNSYGQQAGQHFILDTNGGIIVVWDDSRNTNVDVYLQHIKADGTPGPNNATASPVSTSEPLISIYPNPVVSDLFIEASSYSSKTPVVVSLLDATGRTLETINGVGILTLSMKKYRSSVYVLQIDYDGKRVMKQIVKK